MSRSVGNTPDVTSLQGGTAGQVAYQSAPSTTAFAGPGTSGQVLTSNGASAPTFQTVSAGAVSPTYTVYTSGSGTYTSPVGCTYMIVETVGPGGGGGKSLGSSSAGAGGGGGYQKVKVSPGSYSYVVGTGGAGTATAGNDGGVGTDTSFGTRGTTRGSGGSGSTNVGGIGGGYGGGTGTLIFQSTGRGGDTGSGNGYSTIGGSTVLGHGSSRSASGVVPSVAAAPGVGGAGVDTFTAKSAAGAAGIIIITEYY